MLITKEILDTLGVTKEDVLNAISDSLYKNDLNSGINIRDNIQDLAMKAAHKYIKNYIDNYIETICKDSLEPIVKEKFDHFIINETNSWGESINKKGKTITEHLVQCIDGYLSEKVNEHGKSKSENSGSYSHSTARATYHLNKAIENRLNKTIEELLEAGIDIMTDKIQDEMEKSFEGIKERITSKRAKRQK